MSTRSDAGYLSIEALRQIDDSIIALRPVYPQGSTKGVRSITDQGSTSRRVRRRLNEIAGTPHFSVPFSQPASARSSKRDQAHGVNCMFIQACACPERTHSFQIVPEIEGWAMTEFQYLQDQAARAERLARNILDAVTVERLLAFAAECREKASRESARGPQAA
jgi:hypothetical protein